MSTYGVVTEPGTVRIERKLPGPIERVWDHLTNSELRGRWLASGPLEPRLGGSVELNFRHAGLSGEADRAPDKYRDRECHQTSGHVTAWQPPRLLAYTWGGESEVTFELTPEQAGILLVVTHRRLPSRDMMLSVSAGWHVHLDILSDQLRDKPPRPFWSNHTRLEAEYDRLLPTA